MCNSHHLDWVDMSVFLKFPSTFCYINLIRFRRYSHVIICVVNRSSKLETALLLWWKNSLVSSCRIEILHLCTISSCTLIFSVILISEISVPGTLACRPNVGAWLWQACLREWLQSSSFIKHNIVTCRGLFTTYKTGSGFDDWIYWHLIRTTRNYKQYSAVADLHTSQFTVTHAVGFSVFTSRILATDL
jgi:hypothetical protein